MSDTVEGPVLERIRLDALEDWWKAQIQVADGGSTWSGDWDQAIFRRAWSDGCGARFCLAGKAADWDGEWVSEDTEIWLRARPGDPAEELETRVVNGFEVQMVTAWERAKVVLGLTADEASALFTGLNDVDDVRHAFDLIRSGELRKLCPSCGQTLFRCIHETTYETCMDKFHTREV